MIEISPQTLHEDVSRKLKRAPNGCIYTKDLKDIFSLLIICLDLDDKVPKSKFNPLSAKTFPYAFTLERAIETMAHLNLTINLEYTSTVISYTVKTELATILLKSFMESKMIHAPADRTRSEPKHGVLLQPTAKGVAVLQIFCQKLGIKGNLMPPILLSPFNSMELLAFERSIATDTIIYLQYLSHLVFAKLMGPSPNVWSPSSDPDPISIRKGKEELFNDLFDFGSTADSFMVHWDDIGAASTCKGNPSQMPETPTQVSPFAHRFFTNPESDSHVQYYVSDKGVRLFHNKKFGSDNTQLQYTFTGKAALQWLMDCTDIMYAREARAVLNLIHTSGLIRPVRLTPSTSPANGFQVSKTSYYALNIVGVEEMEWNLSCPQVVLTLSEIEHSTHCLKTGSIRDIHRSSGEGSSNSIRSVAERETNLEDVLRDPGLRYVFKRYLEERFCAENLEVYLELKKYQKLYQAYLNLLKGMKVTEKFRQENSLVFSQVVNPFQDQKGSMAIRKNIQLSDAVANLSNECLSCAYNIYTSYIAIGAPLQLNLNHEIREIIGEVMVHPHSPIMQHFNFMESPSTTEERLLGMVSSDMQGGGPKVIGVTEGPIASMVSVSPTEFSEVSRFLHTITPLLEKVERKIYRLMEIDSFPKFLTSLLYPESTKIQVTL
ncbi:hypothetical protein BABINDRAFT_36378 [Babjeviella inositovora NRRL Y-12698]|uniref:RGS domain-containing protein n=1 Tax=Babjeviella inositovora NRRL Y-12698 TaxID=984486 RepID=A0A1E3QQD3_9ASCO|nr:uncharacterized protein BABINDRAFT_36378 [Babjeviella inositovora NRRL Y-12698]ODQ79881.1 hypothetical protein BABINDRAFT_36378 [Babjeviella inositovora NRRL Y-12698]